MNLNGILFGLLPLIIFVIVDAFWGLKAGVIAAIIFGIIEGIYEYTQMGHVDTITMVSVGLIVVLGVISIRINDSRYFKFQPVAVGVLTAAFLAYYQIFDQPLLIKLIPLVETMVTPEQLEIIQSPYYLKLLGTMSFHLIFVFLIHAAIVAYAALRMSTMSWILLRGVGIYVLLFSVAFIDARLMAPHGP